jgi:flagellin-like protein
MEQKGVSPVVGTILLIAITVALAAIVAMLVSGLGGRGAPPSAMLTVTAECSDNENNYNVTLTVSHEGGDDLVPTDITVQVIENDGDMKTIQMESMDGGGVTFTVGKTVTTTYGYGVYPLGEAITVYIIHEPSKQKMFSSSTVVVSLA